MQYESAHSVFLLVIDTVLFVLVCSVIKMSVSSTVGRARALEGHPAQLGFADCLSYACAASGRVPILFKGRDVTRTDLAIVS